MQVKARYSHLNGEEYLLVHRKALWEEVQDVIAGIDGVQIVEIEAGRSNGSVHTLRKLADALGVAVDDVIPASDDETPYA